MNRLEDELRWALQRREPPPGFADRVMARVPRPWYERLFGVVVPQQRWAPAMAATLLAVLVGGTWQYKRIEEQREGERAAQELRVALQVTSSQLQSAKAKLLRKTGGSI